MSGPLVRSHNYNRLLYIYRVLPPSIPLFLSLPFLDSSLDPSLPLLTPSLLPSLSPAYGLGLLMVLIVCIGSLAGIVIVPFIHTKSPIAKLLYSYVHAFMVALAISALVSDALLHLIPLVSTVLVSWSILECVMIWCCVSILECVMIWCCVSILECVMIWCCVSILEYTRVCHDMVLR